MIILKINKTTIDDLNRRIPTPLVILTNMDKLKYIILNFKAYSKFKSNSNFNPNSFVKEYCGYLFIFQLP